MSEAYKLVDKIRSLVEELDKALNEEEKRPEDKDELTEILEKYSWGMLTPKGQEEFKRELRAWKEKDHIVQSNEMVGKEEKMKKLWEVIHNAGRSFEDQAKVALEAVERVIDKLILGDQMIMVNKQRLKDYLREELL